MTEKKNVRRRGILRRRLFEVLETRRARRFAGSNPAPKRVDEEEKKRKEDELPPEFKPLERKYGKKMARTAYKFIENYINSMFGEEE